MEITSTSWRRDLSGKHGMKGSTERVDIGPRVAGFDTPFPYTLEHVYLPDTRRVMNAIEHVLNA